MEGKLHYYYPKRTLNLFEYTPSPLSSSSSPSSSSSSSTAPSKATPPNVLLFVGGLYDNFQNPGYTNDLARLFPRHSDGSQKWTVMHIQLSSAMRSFGTSNLDKDIDEIATGVRYIREVLRRDEPTTNVVLMGHSTGCQDTLRYLYVQNPTDAKFQPRPQVQGAILQAPVSDRDAVMVLKVNVDPEMRECFDKCLKLVATIPADQHGTYMMPLHWTRPLFGAGPLSVSRFLDFASPESPANPRNDDLFSADLYDERLLESFGMVGKNGLLASPTPASSSETATTTEGKRHPEMLMLFSSDDEQISHPNSEGGTLGRWTKALAADKSHPVLVHKETKLIENAEHGISGDAPAAQHARLVVMRESVLRYIDDVVGGVDETAWKIWSEDARRIAESIQVEAGAEKGVGDLKL